MTEIKHRITATVLFTSEKTTTAEAVVEAVARGADLRGADLSRADLSGADLSGADLKKAYAQRQIVPQSGSFEAWKKLKDGTLAHLLIPAGSARVGGLIGRKCRAEYVVVLSGSGVSNHDGKTKYEAGETVRADTYDPDPLVECSGGVHFFLTREEAQAYEF